MKRHFLPESMHAVVELNFREKQRHPSRVMSKLCSLLQILKPILLPTRPSEGDAIKLF